MPKQPHGKNRSALSTLLVSYRFPFRVLGLRFLCHFSTASHFSQIAPRSCPSHPLPPARAMDSSHHSIQYHLARALMHLNQIASFLPSFELPADWGPNPAIPRHHGQSSARHLHTFVPLPTEPRPPASLASHGGLPSHFVTNPEPRFRDYVPPRSPSC